MATISPQTVKELREKTGAGMGDCKSALVESDGDMQAAIEILRKKGAASAAKRSDRAANEGLIITKTSVDSKTGVIIEVNSETDFVARNAEFGNYVNLLADTLLANNISTHDELLLTKVGTDTIGGIHNEILAKLNEKIEIRRFEKITTDGYIADYIHAGSKLAVLLEVSVNNLSEKARGLVRDITMQVAAMNPQFIYRTDVTEATIEKEKEIYRELSISEGKKPDIAERIATGRLEKFFQEQCLFEQTFVKDPTKTIKDVVAEITKDCGQDLIIKSFRRYFLGE